VIAVAARPSQTENIDLGRLSLEHGQARQFDIEISPAAVRLGNESYAIAGSNRPAKLDVSRTTSGYALRLRFEAPLEGPCVRCLEPAELRISVDAREVDQPGAGDEELRSPYVDGEELHVAHWVDDALVLATPSQPLCRADCAGLCPVCGASLNDADPADHEHGERRDPRWAKLDELKLD
jgi:uncharacterized protein